MTTKPDHQRSLLAGALDANGKLVHEGLRMLRPGPYALGDVDWLPNPDPMALIAACRTRHWSPHFTETDNQIPWLCLYIPHEGAIHSWLTDDQAALTDVVFQATVPLAANWGECPCSQDYARIDHELCSPCDAMPVGECNALCSTGCAGTGKVLTGAKKEVV